MSNNDDNHNIGIAVEQISIDESHINNEPDLEGLSILPTRNLVLFPCVTITISLQRAISEKVAVKAYKEHKPIGIVCQQNPDDDAPTLMRGLYRYGVLADILKIIELPNGDKTVLVRSREPFRVIGQGKKTGHVTSSLSAKIEIVDETLPDPNEGEFKLILKEIKSKLHAVSQSFPEPLSHMMAGLAQCDEPVLLINTLLTNIPGDSRDKIILLRENDMQERALGLLQLLVTKEQEINITKDIMHQVKSEMDDEQRRAFLHQQMVNIQEQLYGDTADDFLQLEHRSHQLPLSADAQRAFDKELTKLRRLNPQSPDYSVIYTYLDTLLSLPWQNPDELNHTFSEAKEILDNSHSGLEKVKERILEQIAVIMHNPNGRSPILCLVGPPGVGKTSIGKAVADALGRKYQRVSLGGLHDESEIRGHRRTYIGAMPGRIIEAMRKAGTTNPVLVLDEIDKIGADYKGDPAAALLEVLDPEQNCRFHDNYIDIDYDLSDVLFIATANTLSTVAQPLIDRMEVIDLSGYLPEEKIDIARNHLIPRICVDLLLGQYIITDDALLEIIEYYTNESGVRQLEKALTKIGRKMVMSLLDKDCHVPMHVEKDDVKDFLGIRKYSKDKYESNAFAGVVTGLAWTQTGGEILLVESSLTPGKGDKFTVTGNLGDVMKESTAIALQWVKAHATELGIDTAIFDKYNVHIHFPEGAIPKDGPSAGITIATSLVSLFTQKRVRERLAMTGEITLRGKVLPVGGIKEKILAAKRAGITDIIMSEENRKDVEDIPAKYVDGLEFHYVNTVLDVMGLAVTDQPVIDAKSL